jgi:hypothetical protein
MRKIKTGIGILLIAAISVSLTSCKDLNGQQESPDDERLQLYAEQKSHEETVKNDVKEVKSGPVDFTETAKKVLDAVVHIRATQTSIDKNSDMLPRELPDFFRGFRFWCHYRRERPYRNQ